MTTVAEILSAFLILFDLLKRPLYSLPD